uniref:Uncharacterized protein n=1 Tax=Triatoma infestans TaxID=30076 RepID=A0A170XM04_TRIIF
MCNHFCRFLYCVLLYFAFSERFTREQSCFNSLPKKYAPFKYFMAIFILIILIKEKQKSKD